MFTNSDGKEVLTEEPIFPLVSFNPDTKIWKCVGTGFFIQAIGGFVTAKHVFFENDGTHLPTVFAIQTTSSNERHVRVLKHFVAHESADIAVGLLGPRRLHGGKNVPSQNATPFTLNFGNINIEDQVRTYAFPLSERKALDSGEYEFTFKGKWSAGKVVEYCEDGSPLVRNPCYQTTMLIDHGASGGPVLKNNLVVAINSSSMQVLEGETPISFITPIDFILDLSVPENDTLIPIKELIEKGVIPSK